MSGTSKKRRGASKTAKPVAAEISPELERFFQCVRDTRPFAINRVSDPSQIEADVPTIHEREFDKLCDLAREVSDRNAAEGTILCGGAGVGKSHLLARLATWAAKEERACFVFLHNIQVNGDDLPRYLLKCVIYKLAEDRLHRLRDTPLFRIVDAAIRDAAKRENITRLTDKNRAEVYRKLAARLGGDSKIFKAVFTFFESAILAEKASKPEVRTAFDVRAGRAARWLAGDMLDPDEARDLTLSGAKPEEGIELRDDAEIEQVLITIGRLAHVSRKPLILCIDQVDNMREDRVKSLFRFLHTLLDHGKNLQVIVSGVQETLNDFRARGTIAEGAWDRLRQPIVLGRISPADARRIVEARLDVVVSEFEDVPDVQDRKKVDRLFPLHEGWFVEQIGAAVEIRPRDIRWPRAATWRSRRGRGSRGRSAHRAPHTGGSST